MLSLRRILPFLATLGLAFLIAAAADARPLVHAARVGVHPDKTRFVMEMTEEVEFRVFALDDPYRVVVDFPEVDWAPDAGKEVPGFGLVQRFRYGLFQVGTVRVVLDLREPARVRNAFFIPPRDGYATPRFVLDLEAVPAEAFATEKDRVLGGRADVATQVGLTVPEPPVPPGAPGDGGKPLIVIDPGHGGVDPGAIGVGGVYEKNVTLEVAKRLKAELEGTGRFRVMLTRDRDVFIRLRDRPAIARHSGADLFVSLHADSADDAGLHGASIYTLSDTASDREAGMLAAKENRADALAGIDLAAENDEVASILIDLAQRDTRNQSARVANLLVEEMRGHKLRLLGKPLRSAGFAVLTAPDVPSILIEMGYLSNRNDAKHLSGEEAQAQLVRSLARGIDSYFLALATLRRT